jgi:predicted Zn-dependent peptidase
MLPDRPSLAVLPFDSLGGSPESNYFADGITDDELDIAKGYLTGAFELGLEDTGSRMARAAGLLITTGQVRPVAEQVARWEAVQQADTRRVIERILSEPLTLVALGPIDDNVVPEGLRSI